MKGNKSKSEDSFLPAYAEVTTLGLAGGYTCRRGDSGRPGEPGSHGRRGPDGCGNNLRIGSVCFVALNESMRRILTVGMVWVGVGAVMVDVA